VEVWDDLESDSSTCPLTVNYKAALPTFTGLVKTQIWTLTVGDLLHFCAPRHLRIGAFDGLLLAFLFPTSSHINMSTSKSLFDQSFTGSHGNNNGNGSNSFNNNSLIHIGPKNTLHIQQADSAGGQALKAVGIAAIGVAAALEWYALRKDFRKDEVQEKRKVEGPYKDLDWFFR